MPPARIEQQSSIQTEHFHKHADNDNRVADADRGRIGAALLARYQAPIARQSIWQLTSTAGLFLVVLACMYVALHVTFWITLALAVPAAGLVVRLFIIQHDCGHRAYFRSRRVNDIVGLGCSLITFAPYANWRQQHALHHAVWNNLDRRDRGLDIYSSCMTVHEYQALPPFRRLLHRFLLHPLMSQLLLPPLIFLVLYRWPFDSSHQRNRERISVWITDLALLALYGSAALVLGIGPVLLVQLTIMIIASIVGVWLFSIQHRFESAVWMTQAAWNPKEAALHGSSYLRLPRVLQWFTGNIGFHHLHHLSPRIPNYRLEQCQRALAAILPVENVLSLGQAFRAARFTLWDEDRGRMVRFGEVG